MQGAESRSYWLIIEKGLYLLSAEKNSINLSPWLCSILTAFTEYSAVEYLSEYFDMDSMKLQNLRDVGGPLFSTNRHYLQIRYCNIP